MRPPLLCDRHRVAALLVASHIAPWSTHAAARTNPRNGLCLSRLHNTAFDRGLITFVDEYRMVLSNTLRQHTTNAVLSASFTPFEGRPLRHPLKFAPDASFLQHHREWVFCG